MDKTSYKKKHEPNCKSLKKNGKNCGTEMARDFLDVPSFAAAECLLTEILEQAMGKNK